MQRALCEDYLNDKLSVEERKAFEERLAMGDKELIETLKQLKAYRQHGGEFLGNEKFEDHNLLELVKESEHSEEQTKAKRNEQGLADTIQEIETRQQTKQKKSFSMFLGVLLIGLVLFVTYQQWNTYIVSSKNDLLLKKNAILEKERAEYQIAN